MHKMILMTLVLLLAQLSPVAGADLVEGKRLFHDKSLGTNDKSCATCHAEGKGLQDAGGYDQEMLQDLANFCIRDALKGQLLQTDAPQLADLAAYIRTFYLKK